MMKGFEINPPIMPNFLIVKTEPGRRQDGIKDTSIPVSSLTREEAEEFAELMKQTFLQHWENKVNIKANNSGL